MVKREHSFLHFPSKPWIFVPQYLGGMGGNGFRFNENFVKTPKIPLNLSPFYTSQQLFSQPTVKEKKKKYIYIYI